VKNRLNRLKTLSVTKIELKEEVKEEVLNHASGFPLMISPVHSGLDLNHWISNNKEKFESHLLHYGGVLFRGFKINTVDKFQRLMDSFPKETLEYKMRSSPRHSLAGNVYVSTTYPPDQSINMHSESSYAPVHPERIIFCCITAADEQGETPIADNRKVWSLLSETTREKFKTKGVKYRRNLSGFLGLPWQEVFQTDNKDLVEQECQNNHMEFSWEGDDRLVIEWNKKAVWEHPVSEEQVWFNHGLFFNKHMLDEKLLNTIKSEDQIPNNTFFGDGTQITKEEIDEIRTAYEKSTVVFPWQEGDVLFLDNMLMSHGRNPYKGERKIIVSMH
jgi:alpha-ketoglutarate-dependent taurine dioxygenase